MINKEKLEKQLNILERVAERLKNGLITSGNVAHTGMVQGATIENVAHNIRKILDEAEEKPTFTEEEYNLARAAAYEAGKQVMKQELIDSALIGEVTGLRFQMQGIMFKQSLEINEGANVKVIIFR